MLLQHVPKKLIDDEPIRHTKEVKPAISYPISALEFALGFWVEEAQFLLILFFFFV